MAAVWDAYKLGVGGPLRTELSGRWHYSPQRSGWGTLPQLPSYSHKMLLRSRHIAGVTLRVGVLLVSMSTLCFPCRTIRTVILWGGSLGTCAPTETVAYCPSDVTINSANCFRCHVYCQAYSLLPQYERSLGARTAKLTTSACSFLIEERRLSSFLLFSLGRSGWHTDVATAADCGVVQHIALFIYFCIWLMSYVQGFTLVHYFM
jgi:hypothetical protein